MAALAPSTARTTLLMAPKSPNSMGVQQAMLMLQLLLQSKRDASPLGRI
jgi:hypothetical protein